MARPGVSVKRFWCDACLCWWGRGSQEWGLGASGDLTGPVPASRYTALRPQDAQVSVTRPGSSEPRGGLRWMSVAPQDGQTSGFRSRSATIKIRASGARYSLMPRRPMASLVPAVQRPWRVPPRTNLFVSGSEEQAGERGAAMKRTALVLALFLGT